MNFKQLGIIDPILKAVEELGYETPSEIQLEAIPYLIDNRDLLGCAQTGTGKTAAFAIPILQKLSKTKVAKPAPIRA
ncbi:MAG: DEAD/DEAH box helicase, partial [Clostridia bacterium]